MAHYYTREAREVVREVHDRVRPDAVVAAWFGGARLIDGIVDPARVVLDLDNAEHIRFSTMAARARGAQRALLRADALLFRRWMERSLPHYASVTLASDADAAACAAVAPSARLVVAENGADLVATAWQDPARRSVVLLGDLGYSPNADALTWFASSILPRCASVEEVRVVGGGALPPLEPVDRRVTHVGFVPDVGTELGRASVLAVPLRAGAGTRLKILEAMAAGVPVVTTRVGASGLDVEHERQVLVADGAADFADALERVLADADLRRELSERGRALIEARYEWRTTMRPLVAAVEETARGVAARQA
jgi:hypothetical protein